YPPLFLKPDETVANALRLFKRAHRPMALVRDDEGVILGLITLEDVLEEIVGDIEDEHDRPTPRVSRSALRRLPPRPNCSSPRFTAGGASSPPRSTEGEKDKANPPLRLGEGAEKRGSSSAPPLRLGEGAGGEVEKKGAGDGRGAGPV